MAAAESALQRVLSRAAVAAGPPLIASQDGRAAVAPIPLSADLSGFALRDTITALRNSATTGAPADLAVLRARKKETPEHGTRDGIVRAVSATGPVITSAGIVMAAPFCVLAVLPLIVLTQLGVIVGLGILLDTFIVRTVVIPALFTVIGPRIWWPAKVDDTFR